MQITGGGPARNRPRISPVAKTFAPSPRLVWAPPEPRSERCSKQDSASEARLDCNSRCKWATSLITVLAEDAQKGTIFKQIPSPSIACCRDSDTGQSLEQPRPPPSRQSVTVLTSKGVQCCTEVETGTPSDGTTFAETPSSRCRLARSLRRPCTLTSCGSRRPSRPPESR